MPSIVADVRATPVNIPFQAPYRFSYGSIASLTKTVVEIETFGIAEETIERLRQAPGVASISVEEREQAQVLLVQSAKGLELTQSLLAMLEGTTVGRVAAREPTLEDAYIALVDTA